MPLPAKNHYAVIFTATLIDDTGYNETAERMVTLAQQQPGFIAIESARNPDGRGITVSYWQSEADVIAWKQNTEHLVAQAKGRQQFYGDYHLEVARIERAYAFEKKAK